MPEDGRLPIERPGFSYLPKFITKEESEELIEYFGAIRPIWERRHRADDHQRRGRHSGRLTRPVYWLGAWQFACLGYYAEPDHRTDRCVRGEPFPQVMQRILDRVRGPLQSHPSGGLPVLPNTCLINYYGREVGRGVPVDFARLRMHRDGEPGPVVMFNIGQPGLLEFLDPDRSPDPELRVWTRHRSVTILSGPDFKDRLYHRIVQVRNGGHPKMGTTISDFELRRISVSFRHVPDELISDFIELPVERRERVREYVQKLSAHSGHYRAQLRGPGGLDTN
jgi:hypothetical protein